MTEVRAGSSATLLSQWYAYPGGPAADVSGLTITIVPSGGGAAVVGPTSTGVVHEATGLYSYAWSVGAAQAAGTYIATWSATGGLTAVEPVTVLDAGTGRVYATSGDLTAYPVTVPAGVSAGLLLQRASRDVDRALLTAVYETDDDGMPTDADIRQALRDATCEQVAGYLDSGDLTGTGAAPPTAGFTIGKISVQRGGQGASGGAVQSVKIGVLYPQAWQVLQQAGLTGQGPYS